LRCRASADRQRRVRSRRAGDLREDHAAPRRLPIGRPLAARRAAPARARLQRRRQRQRRLRRPAPRARLARVGAAARPRRSRRPLLRRPREAGLMAIRITRVYTRTGDRGETALVGGRRIPKDSPRIIAYGAIDELNSVLGIVRTLAAKESGAGPARLTE